MQSKPLFFKASLLFLLCSTTYAFYLPAFVLSGDINYQIIKSPKQEVIFSPQQRKEAENFFQKSQDLHQKYEKSFDFNLTQTNYTGLASHHNQISNGFATFLPLLMNGFYSGGAAQIDYFGSLSWMDMLMIHEFAHTYQLDAKTNISHNLQYIFGNTGLWFINPNYLLPTAIIEGNAVMNESRFGIGGRLYVGEHRALVYALSHDNKLNYTRLLNNHLDFPYTKEKYLVGGYLWAYIVKRFSIEKANSYFKQHATHYINPLRINKSFQEHFGIDYKTMISDFLIDLHTSSKNMHFLQGELISKAHFIGDLNANGKEIFWISSQETSKTHKNIYVKNGSYKSKETTLSRGKVFKIKGAFYTASQLQVDANHITSGLFDEELEIKKESKDFFIFDQRAGHEVGFYIPSSFNRAQLYKDKKFFKTVDSSAILDEKGNVYYAKQTGDQRLLYKNDKIIATWKGYSQKLLEVKDNKVYFIAPTLLGSSLFYAYKEKIYRANDADNIVDARLIDEEYFLAVTIDGDGYNVLKAKLERPINQKPFLYDYGLKQTQLGQKIDLHASQAKVYSPFGNLHYGGISSFAFGYGSYAGFTGLAELMFVDPMHQNELIIRGGSWGFKQEGLISYNNREHLLNYALFASYDAYDYFDANSTTSIEVGRLGLNLSYPIFKKEREIFTLSLQSYLEIEDSQTDLALEGSLFYRYGERYGIAYDWHKYQALRINYKYKEVGQSLSINHSTTNELISDLFVKTELSYHKSDEYVALNNWDYSRYRNSNPNVLSIYSMAMWFQTKEAAKINMEMAYAFKSGLYYDVWPFSLRRTALNIGLNYVSSSGGDILYSTPEIQSTPFDFYEIKLGLDFEILAFHLSAESNIEVFASYNSYLNEIEYNFGLGINY